MTLRWRRGPRGSAPAVHRRRRVHVPRREARGPVDVRYACPANDEVVLSFAAPKARVAVEDHGRPRARIPPRSTSTTPRMRARRRRPRRMRSRPVSHEFEVTSGHRPEGPLWRGGMSPRSGGWSSTRRGGQQALVRVEGWLRQGCRQGCPRSPISSTWLHQNCGTAQASFTSASDDHLFMDPRQHRDRTVFHHDNGRLRYGEHRLHTARS